MTMVDPRTESTSFDLPPGLELSDDMRNGFRNVVLGVGNVLVGQLDPLIINEYDRNSPEALAIASVMCDLNESLPTSHRLTMGQIPGASKDDVRIGLWVMPVERD